MTVEEALTSSLLCGLQDVLIIAYGPSGELFIRSSGMDRKDALWLTELAKQHVLDVDE